MEILDLVEFKNWADSVHLQYIEELTEVQFNEIVPTVNKSIRELLLHIYSSYWGDYHLLTDRDWSNQPEFESMDKNQIISGINDYNRKMVDFIKNNPTKSALTYHEPDVGKTVSTTVENLLFNFVTHSAYHRGQMSLLLRYHGLESIEMTDFNPYINKFKQNNE